MDHICCIVQLFENYRSKRNKNRPVFVNNQKRRFKRHAKIMTKLKRISVEEYFAITIRKLKTENRFSTQQNYANTCKSFLAFCRKRIPYMDEIDRDMVERYNRYLTTRGTSRNTASFYNRVLRSLYNRAVKEGYAPENHPFDDVYTGVDTTRKRALPLPCLKRLRTLDLEDDPPLRHARNYFLFSFYTRGMSFIDLAYLKRSDLSKDAISYVRRKTGQRIIIRREPCMDEIISIYKRYHQKEYVFPIIRSGKPETAFKEYRARLHLYNEQLKELGRRIGCPFPLNSYAARHTWATLARDAKIPLQVISSGMGHTSERTTEIYLASLDNSVVDQANRQVLDLLDI